MKDIRITYTYHLNSLDMDEEPTTGSLVLQVEDAIAAELLLADLSQSIAGRHIGTAIHCVCEMLLWYCSMHYRYIHSQPLHITLTVEPVNKARSTAQNSLMWALLTIMADHYNGGRTGGVTPEDCYLEMLEKYGAKVDYLEVPAGALDILRGCYRLVHLVEILDNNRCTVKCTQGSSTFTTQEMKNLIDGIFDRLAEMGVSDPLVTAYWQEWSEP